MVYHKPQWVCVFRLFLSTVVLCVIIVMCYSLGKNSLHGIVQPCKTLQW